MKGFIDRFITGWVPLLLTLILIIFFVIPVYETRGNCTAYCYKIMRDQGLLLGNDYNFTLPDDFAVP